MTVTEINAVFTALDLASNTRAERERFRAKMVDVLYDLLMCGLIADDRRLRVSPAPEPRK